MSTAIRSFTFDVAAADLDDLQSRPVHTRWPERETSTDWSQGIPLAYTQEVCAYWRERYDWRRCEAQLNAYPQFITALDGLDIQFMHVRSPHPVWSKNGCVANFAQEVVKGQLPLSVGGIRRPGSRTVRPQ